MPYSTLRDLPERVSDNLPTPAQEIFKEAYNSAWSEYADAESRRGGDDSREEVANKVAWSAVKRKYEKGDDGRWQSKD